MKLDKAIEILQLNIKSVGTSMPTDTLTAVKLGIEAMNRIQAHRLARHPVSRGLLPGETT